MAIGVPQFYRGILGQSSATQDLITSLRGARATATSRGIHVRVSISSTSYTVQRLKLDGSGNWVADSLYPAQTFSAPPAISFSTTQGDGIVEFDTRGLVIPPSGQTVASIETLSVLDTRTNTTKSISVWPSGQALGV